MEKKLLDTKEEIIRLNKTKKGIMDRMAIIELEKGTDNEDYHNLVSLYKRTYNILKDEVDKLDVIEKLKIKCRLSRENPAMYDLLLFSSIVTKMDDEYIELKKSLLDLDNVLLELYTDDESQEEIVDMIEKLKSLEIPVEEEDFKVNCAKINNYISSDFANVLYSEVCKYLEVDEITDEIRQELLRIKYNLLFFSPSLEKRAVDTSFYTSDIPNLTPIDYIHDAGMEYETYTNFLDNVISQQLEYYINYYLSFARNNHEIINLDDLLVLKAYASILSDYELIDCIQMEENGWFNTEYTITYELIKRALQDGKENAKNNNKIRKYGLIEREIL